MKTTRHQYGQTSEDRAVTYLAHSGYTIIERNYKTACGEIDIIAKDGDALVFVEVKARRSMRYGHPKWALTPKKRRTLSMVALCWLKQHKKFGKKARFDVVAICGEGPGRKIEILKNAFDLAYG